MLADYVPATAVVVVPCAPRLYVPSASTLTLVFVSKSQARTKVAGAVGGRLLGIRHWPRGRLGGLAVREAQDGWRDGEKRGPREIANGSANKGKNAPAVLYLHLSPPQSWGDGYRERAIAEAIRREGCVSDNV